MGLLLLLLCFIEISVSNANSVYPDQTPHSVASDIRLPYLPITLLCVCVWGGGGGGGKGERVVPELDGCKHQSQ